MPTLMCLLDQIGEIPPHDFLAIAQLRAGQEAAEREQRNALGGLGVVKGKVRRRTDGD